MRPEISPFYVMEALAEAESIAATGIDVIHLSVGQPSARLPFEVIKSAQDALARDTMGYTHSLGLMPLREAIAAHYSARYGIEVSAAQIAVTVGSSIGCALALMSAFSGGDNIGIGVPYYPAYPNMLKALQLFPQFIRTDASTSYQPTKDMLESLTLPLAGLMIASPSNPAGTIISPDSLAQICEWCDAQGTRLISDEIYHGITYGDSMADTALRYSKRAIVINSFSKYFLMPGYRLGWVVMPSELMRNYESLLQSFVISAPTLSQYVALEMLSHTDLLDAQVHRYATNRDILLNALVDMGFTDISAADGAFYLYANSSALDENSANLCSRILYEAHVSIVPGRDFDDVEGKHMVRVSYCGDTARIKEASERLLSWHAKRHAA